MPNKASRAWNRDSLGAYKRKVDFIIKKQKKEFEKRDTLNWKLEMRKQKEALLGRVEADE